MLHAMAFEYFFAGSAQLCASGRRRANTLAAPVAFQDERPVRMQNIRSPIKTKMPLAIETSWILQVIFWSRLCDGRCNVEQANVLQALSSSIRSGAIGSFIKFDLGGAVRQLVERSGCPRNSVVWAAADDPLARKSARALHCRKHTDALGLVRYELVVVPMDRGLAFNPVPTLLLDDRCAVTGLVLLDYGRVVAIAVPVQVAMVFAHCYPGADRPGANADLVRHRGHRKGADRCNNQQIFLHSVLLPAP
jgi:hypothetical protein